MWRHENLIYLVETISKDRLFRSNLYAILPRTSGVAACLLGFFFRAVSAWLPGALVDPRGCGLSTTKEKKRPSLLARQKRARESNDLLSFGIGSTFCLSLSLFLSLFYIFDGPPHLRLQASTLPLARSPLSLPFLSVTLGDIKPRVASREIHL